MDNGDYNIYNKRSVTTSVDNHLTPNIHYDSTQATAATIYPGYRQAIFIYTYTYLHIFIYIHTNIYMYTIFIDTYIYRYI